MLEKIEVDKNLLQKALMLSIFTIVYNILEGIISIYFGMADDTLALFGFGVDSFVEVISGIGILHMLLRMKTNKVGSRDNFEKTALRITGSSFYMLTAGLVIGSAINIFINNKPETTLPGLVISVISLLTMFFLYKSKFHLGKKLNSDAIIADANCTKTCFNLSILLLLSSAIYELSGIGFIDSLGSLGIAWFAYKEGKEAFEKVSSGNLLCKCSDHCGDNNGQ